MRHPTRLALAALTAALLSACAEPLTAPPAASGPLNQQDVNQTAQNLSDQLLEVFDRAAQDEGVVALQGFPQDSVMTNPFFGYGVSAAQHRAKGAKRLLGALAKNDLPRGNYSYTESENGSAWVRTGDSDDLNLTWPYGTNKEATAAFNWDALSPTVQADAYSESIEVPTGLNMTLTADGQSAANVNVETTYYTGCGTATLEPTSLTVNGAGSLLQLENVGYQVRESDAGDSVTTQGKVSLTGSPLTLEWNVAVNGELTRQGCVAENFVPEDGSLFLSLSGFEGDTQSVALNLTFSGTDEPDLRGSLVVNGDESRTVTFSGKLSDADGNGVPGDDVTVRFPDGSSATLEDLLENIPTAHTFSSLQHHR